MENNSVQTAKKHEEEFFLSEVLGAGIRANGKKIGKLADLVIVEAAKIPEVSHLVVARPFGYPSLVIPMNLVRSFKRKEIVIGIESPEPYEKKPAESGILLKDHILDKKVLDIEDKEVEVVYDIRMVLRSGRLHVTDVDVSRYGLLRRMGLKFIADIVRSLNPRDGEDERISWTYVQPLPSSMGSFRGDVKLNILMETLSEIHPVDLADILEELDNEQRVIIMSGLDTEQASDTLEEIDPNVQRELVSTLNRERVVQLIDVMTPGQAADILSVLPASEAEGIMGSLEADNVTKIRAILERQEESLDNYATPEYIRFPPGTTAREAIDRYPSVAKGKDVIMYLYIVDPEDHLLGVIDIKELLLAEDEKKLGDIMVFDYISLSPGSTLKEAKAMFGRYDFRALPVTDEEHRITGVVPYRDVMNLTHHFIE